MIEPPQGSQHELLTVGRCSVDAPSTLASSAFATAGAALGSAAGLGVPLRRRDLRRDLGFAERDQGLLLGRLGQATLAAELGIAHRRASAHQAVIAEAQLVDATSAPTAWI